MYQDERAITPKNEEEPASNEYRKLKIIIKNTSSHDFKVYQDLYCGVLLSFESGDHCINNESDSNGFEYIGTCGMNTDTTILYERKNYKGPQGTLYFKDIDNGDTFYFKLYFDHSLQPSDPRCTYVYQQGDYSIASPICCFPVLESGSTYRSEFTISDPVLCNNFYHVSGTLFSSRLEEKEYAEVFATAHEGLFDRINRDDRSLGLIHTGGICYKDQHFDDYKKYYLKAGRKEDDFKPKYLKNLYEGYGNHDKSDVIDHIKQRHKNASGHEKHSYDQCMSEGCDSNKNLHYYWTWHGVRFIHLNLAPIDEWDIDGNQGYNALRYLEQILLEWGNQKPVILCFNHLLTYETETTSGHGFLDDVQFKDFWFFIYKFNVCAILCGHQHGVCQPNFSFVFNEELYDTNLRCYCATFVPERFADKREEGYVSYYYRFKFDEKNEKIAVFKNFIKVPDGGLAHGFEVHIADIDITAGPKLKYDIKPVPPKEG